MLPEVYVQFYRNYEMKAIAASAFLEDYEIEPEVIH